MLLNLKTISANDVIAVKLINGEEILARFISEHNDEYKVSKPVMLHLVPTGNGQAQVSFAPFMMGVDTDVELTIPFSRMLTRPVLARQDAAKQYLSSTSGIAL